MERVHRQVLRLGEGFDRLAAPARERIELQEPTLGIGSEDRDAAARRRLVGPQSRDPDRRAGEHAGERRDLAHFAAGLPRRDALAKTVDPLAAHECLDIARVRIDGGNAHAVAQLRLRPDRMGLREQATRVERDDVDRKLLRQDQMRDDLILEAEARGEDDAAAHRLAHEAQRPAGIERIEPLSQILHGKGHETSPAAACRAARR